MVLTIILISSLSLATFIFVMSSCLYNRKFLRDRTLLFFPIAMSVQVLLILKILFLTEKIHIRLYFVVNYGPYALMISAYMVRAIYWDVTNQMRLRKKYLVALMVGFLSFALLGFYAFPVVLFFFVRTKWINVVLCSVILGTCLILFISQVLFYYFNKALKSLTRLAEEMIAVLFISIIVWATYLSVAFKYVDSKDAFLGQEVTFLKSCKVKITVVGCVGIILISHFNTVLPIFYSLYKQRKDVESRRKSYISNLLLDEVEETVSESVLQNDSLLEAIFFYKEVSDFKSYDHLNTREKMESAKIIFKQFMSINADLNIPFPKKIVNEVMDKLQEEETVDLNIFDNAIDFVWYNIIQTSSVRVANHRASAKRNLLNFLFWKYPSRPV